ncbi:iron-sulfur cluster assembly scaffold protein [Sphingomonas aerolata]|uniref:iron-sulfur cluster assembly scaffold protein n=1 Tax=Sphingomonas aerolata TaxID=185951 RepID=UPI002FE09A6D
MNALLYNAEILRLAASIPYHERLTAPMATAERRSPICGSRVTVDVDMGADGRVAAVGLLVRACALGQASSSLLASSIVGRTPAELAAARDAITASARAHRRRTRLARDGCLRTRTRLYRAAPVDPPRFQKRRRRRPRPRRPMRRVMRRCRSRPPRAHLPGPMSDA